MQTGIPWAKNSEFWPLYRHELMRQREAGLLKYSRDRWLPSKKPSPPEGQDARSLGYESVIFPFIVLVFGTVVAVIASFVEYAGKRGRL